METYKELQRRMRWANPKRNTWQWCVANWGCYFLSICQMVGIIPTEDNLKNAYDKAIATGRMITNETTHCYFNSVEDDPTGKKVEAALVVVNALDPQGRKWRFKRDFRAYGVDNPPGFNFDVLCYWTGSGNDTHYVLWEGEDTEQAKKRKIAGHRFFGIISEAA